VRGERYRRPTATGSGPCTLPVVTTVNLAPKRRLPGWKPGQPHFRADPVGHERKKLWASARLESREPGPAGWPRLGAFGTPVTWRPCRACGGRRGRLRRSGRRPV